MNGQYGLWLDQTLIEFLKRPTEFNQNLGFKKRQTRDFDEAGQLLQATCEGFPDAHEVDRVTDGSYRTFSTYRYPRLDWPIAGSAATANGPREV